MKFEHTEETLVAAASRPLQIKTLAWQDDADAARWDRFVEQFADATFFHLAAWQGIIADVFRHRTHYLYAERDGRVVGVLPLAHVKSRLFGNALVSLPFAVYGGAAAEDEVAAAALETRAIELAEALRVDHLEMRQLARHHAEWPRQDLYVTFRKPICADDEANLLAIPRKQRAMVRKGIQRGLVARTDDDVGRFFDLYADNVHRHGTPALPLRYFSALKRAFGDRCQILCVTDSNGRPLSGVLSFYFRDQVLPYYAGDAPAARESAANDFKYWQLMRQAAARGARLFDFGRSKRDTGSFAFKKNWGFEAQPLNYEYRLLRRTGIPQNNPSNPRYALFIGAWRRLPISLANRLGPLIVRNLG
jgi:FemAB-related protein (PEP-CTERM system-associated)